MKKLSLFALAAAGMLLGACSDKDVEQIAQAPAENFENGAFIGLSLQLPSADNTTRANDDLSNGTEDEFAVKNATLYIFKLAKTSTANPDVAATYVDKVSLGNTYDQDDQPGINPDQWGKQNNLSDPTNGTKITSTYNKATLIPNALASQMKADTDNNYYAYVIINHNGQVTETANMTFADFSNQTFSEIGADIAAEKNVWETGLLMTNAPICNYGGGSAAPTKGSGATDPDVAYTTLVPLDNTKIFGSKTEAEEAPASCVYVERAAVKITVEDNRTETTIGNLTVTLQGWQVINNEPTYYNTRHINNDGAAAEDWGPYFNESFTGTTNKYRFVSLYQFNPSLPDGATHTIGYRTYFAKDVQYAANATLNNTVASDARPWIAAGKHAYTTENTFDVAHQTWRNTTMVTLKAQIGGNGFFTVGKGSQVMYVDDPDDGVATTVEKTAEQKAADAIENVLKSDNNVAQALTNLRAKVSENNPTKEVTSGLAITVTVPTEGTPAVPVGKTGVAFTVAPEYTITDNSTTPATVTNYTAFNASGEETLKTALENAIKSVMYSNFDASAQQDDDDLLYADDVLLSYYAGGVSYYNVRIKHFGDVETPWSPSLSAALEAATTGSGYIVGGGDGVNEIYFGCANQANGTPNTPSDTQVANGQKRFLGRYGVVRDNWYKLSIDKIGKIGDAEPVDPSTITPDTPDDEIENYLSVHVHIVPWVLRSQSVEF